MLLRQTILYMPAQLFGPLAQFVAAVVWTHWLSPDAYGQLTAIMAAQELAFVGFLSWWSAYTLRFQGAFETPQDKESFQRSENTILWVSSIGQAVFGIATLFVFHFDITFSLAIWTILFTTSRCLGSHLSERARARGLIATYTIMQLIGPILGFGLAYVAISQLSATPEAALAGFAIAQMIGLAWAWRAMGLSVRVAKPDRETLLRAIRFGLPLVGGGGISWISVNGIRVIVEHLNGTEALGLISVGWGLGQRLASVAAMLVTAAAYPLAVAKLKEGSVADALWQLSAGGALLLGILIPTCVGIILITPEVVDLVIAAPFREVTLAVLPLAAIAGALKNFRVHFFDQTMILLEKTHLTIWLNSIEAVATMIACAIGATTGGLLGAVIGCVIGTIVGVVVASLICVVKFRLPLPWDAGMRITLATIAMGLTVSFMRHNPVFGNAIVQLAVSVAAGGLAYFVSLAALYPRDLMVRLRRLRDAGAASAA